ncbi:hypothetical protein T439DRAFT_357024 [Meredithblackwellia eburnea MCA 4105]
MSSSTLQIPQVVVNGGSGSSPSSNGNGLARPSRPQSLPRSPKSTRGRPRRPKPPPPPTLADKLQNMKNNTYFYPAVAAFLAIFALLVFSALRLASGYDPSAPTIRTEKIKITKQQTNQHPIIVKPKQPRPPTSSSTSTSSPPRNVRLREDSTTTRKEAEEAAAQLAKEALEKAWDLPGTTEETEPMSPKEGEEDTPPPVTVDEEQLRLKASQARFAELMKEAEGMDADELTRMLNQAYRPVA